MAKNKEKKQRTFTNDEKRQAGVVEFTMEDVKDIQNRSEDDVNGEAYEYMVQAMAVSANYMDNTISSEGEVQLDDVYPTTLEETTAMDQLLDKSELAVKDWSDKEYNNMIDILRGIVGWSAKRHFTFSWLIILGSIITVLGVTWLSSSDKENKAKKEAVVENVKGWATEGDFVAADNVSYENYLANAANYKAYKLNLARQNLSNANKYLVQYKASLDTATTKESKKMYKSWIESEEKSIKKYSKDVEEISSWDSKEAKKVALKNAKEDLKDASKSAAFSKFLLIFFLLLIPVYIISSYSYGYTITKHREEAALLEKIRKWGFAIAGGLFGVGLAMDAVDTYRVHWSDGSKTTESEVNPISVAFKFFLYAAALVVLGVVSSAIMLYSTVTGLMRNFNWKEIFADVKGKAQQLQGKAQNLGK